MSSTFRGGSAPQRLAMTCATSHGQSGRSFGINVLTFPFAISSHGCCGPGRHSEREHSASKGFVGKLRQTKPSIARLTLFLQHVVDVLMLNDDFTGMTLLGCCDHRAEVVGPGAQPLPIREGYPQPPMSKHRCPVLSLCVALGIRGAGHSCRGTYCFPRLPWPRLPRFAIEQPGVDDPRAPITDGPATSANAREMHNNVRDSQLWASLWALACVSRAGVARRGGQRPVSVSMRGRSRPQAGASPRLRSLSLQTWEI
jgi:hypothetical protein